MDKKNSEPNASTDPTANIAQKKNLSDNNNSNPLAHLTPIFSREMSLQAHFSFGAQTAGGPHTFALPISTHGVCNAHRNFEHTSSNHCIVPVHGALRCWTADDGSYCSMACGDDGLSVSYKSQQQTCDPQPVKLNSSYNKNTMPVNHSNNEIGHSEENIKPDLPVRSKTFNGTQNSGKTLQKAYGKRCKSTAHIVLKQNEDSVKLPHEFHSLPQRDYSKPRDRSKDSARCKRSEGNSNNGAVQQGRSSRFVAVPEESGFQSGCFNRHVCRHCGVQPVINVPCSCPACLYSHHQQCHNHCFSETVQSSSCCRGNCHHSHCCHDNSSLSTAKCTGKRNLYKCHRASPQRNTSPFCTASSHCRHKSPSPHARVDQKQKKYPPADRLLPQDRKECGPRLPRVGVTYPSHQVEHLGFEAHVTMSCRVSYPH